MITEYMQLNSKVDARQWAATYDLTDRQAARLANWIWAEKPAIGCTFDIHPLSSIAEELFWEIVDGD